MSIPAFPKVYALGTKYIANIFDDEVEITEKVDGSQFVFGRIKGELICRSKGKLMILDAPDKMFKEAVDYILSISNRIKDGLVYWAEYLKKPKHNTVTYDRIPKNHLALFACGVDGNFISEKGYLENSARRLDIEHVPIIYKGKITDIDIIIEMLNRVSFLGGSNIEGVVVKNYFKEYFIADRLHEVMAGKYVSEKFKEKHESEWSKHHTGKGKWEVFMQSFRSQARWEKAIIHLKERDLLEDAPKDIGTLIKEIQKDIIEEEMENIKDFLWDNYKGGLLRHSIAGFPEWYKKEILKMSFERE